MDSELPKITYLFGAGASAIKLPTVKKIPDRIKYVKDYIDKSYVYTEDEIMTVKDFSFKANDAKQFILDGFDKLYNASQNHSTIDTYAKKLHLTSRSSEVNELVFILAFYFSIEQKIVGVDPRYNTFLISILDSSAYSFPPNLKFLSWNYDLQIETAYQNLLYSSDNDLDYNRFNTNEREWHKKEFTSIKINGSCNVFDRTARRFYNLIGNLHTDNIDLQDIDWALKYGFCDIKNRRRFYDARVNINFAWYNDPDTLNKISELHSETEVLVVVGYSFPFFNREVDRKIIRSMSKLKKIYIQDLFPNDIVNRFLSILPDWKKLGIEIIPVNTAEEFFLPPEL
jgi:hypothetical protein